MALNRWLGAALIVSVFGFVGCAEPKKKDPASSPSPVASAAPVETETPEAPETPDVAATPAASATPGATPDAAATPTEAGSTAAGGDHAAQLEDLENADGMEGYEAVMAMTAPASTPELVAKGKGLYETNCASCHGAAGLGDGEAGASLDPPPRNLTATDDYKYGHMDLALYRTGTYGIEGTGMAPWGDIIEADDQWAIGHYIRSIQK